MGQISIGGCHGRLPELRYFNMVALMRACLSLAELNEVIASEKPVRH